MKVFAIRQRLDKSTKYATNDEKTTMLMEEGSQKEAIDYALNSDKTETSCFETSLNLESTETAYEEMQATKEKFRKTGGVLGYHFIQSFKPGEATPEMVHEIGVKFAEELFGDKFEVVIGTHQDKTHLHNHIVMNSVSFVDGGKHHSNEKSYYEDIRGTSDRLCREYGLSVIQTEGKGRHYAEYDAEKKGLPTIRQLVRQDIDQILLGCHTMERFWKQMKDSGYRITRKGDNIKHTSIRPKFGNRNIRLDSLGSQYTEESMKERLYYYRHYLFLLGKVQHNKARPVINAALRGEVLKFQQYQKQANLLRYYQIETETELSLLHEALDSIIESLEGVRKALYREKRNAETSEEKEVIQQEISRLTNELKPLRTQRNLCEKSWEQNQLLQRM